MTAASTPNAGPVLLDRARDGAPRWMLCAAFGAYLACALVLAFQLPAFSGPNEALHYDYIAELRRTGNLPNPSAYAGADERHQPPLYYIVAALASWPLQGPFSSGGWEANPQYLATHHGNLNSVVHAIPETVPLLYVGRLVSTLFGLVGVLAIYWAARETLPPEVSLLVAGLLAFQPMYLFESATLNNDVAVTAAAAVLLAWTTTLVVRDKPPVAFLLWGLLMAVALLLKASAVFLFLLLPTACLLVARRTRDLRRALTCGLLGLLGSLPLWGLWLMLNRQRGQDLFGVAASLPVERLLRLSPADLAVIAPRLGALFRSFWLDWSPGDRGYMPEWFYILWGGALILATLGWLRGGRHGLPGLRVGLLAVHGVYACVLAVAFLAVKALLLRETGFLVPEGRWALPVMPSVAWAVGSGWAGWWAAGTVRRAARLAALVPPLAAVGLLLFWLPQLYPRAQRLAGVADEPAGVLKPGLIYGDVMSLDGIEAGPLRVDKESSVALYWRALTDVPADYVVSLQLLVPAGANWPRLDWQNSYPGSGLTPTRGWRRGDVYRDVLTLVPHGELSGPTRALLVVGLLGDDRSLPATQAGLAVDVPVAQEVVVYPAAPLVPGDEARLRAPVSFGGLFDLVGLAVAERDDQAVLSLWWVARNSTSVDYVAYVHVFDSEGRLVFQADSMPADGLCPTHLWQPGDTVRDERRLSVRLPVGGTLLIGVYDRASMMRLPASQEGQRLPDDEFHRSIGDPLRG